MSTPNEYDPPKTVYSALEKAIQVRDAARAVIAAGRPHSRSHYNVVKPCGCSQCAAYDALAALLKETTS